MTASVPRYGVDKSPSVYDEYSFKLPELYRNVSTNELRELDEVRDESLEKFRKWIANNPHIRKCRTDANFLLRFLRHTQFSVPLACTALEKYLALREMYPKWFKQLDCTEPAMKKIFQSSYCSYLGQDSMGRSVVLFQYGRFDPREHDVLQLGRIAFLLAQTMLEWEEFQIGGCRVFVDYRDTSMEHCTMLDSTSLKILMDAFSRAFPLRYEAIHAAKLPKFAHPVADIMLAYANPKFREKVFCYSSMDEFTVQFEECLKPTIYGGAVDLDKSNVSFWEKIEQQRDVILGLDEMEIDLDYYSSMFDDDNSATNDDALMALFRQMETQ